jgi:hypothetical protein
LDLGVKDTWQVLLLALSFNQLSLSHSLSVELFSSQPKLNLTIPTHERGNYRGA